MGKQLNKFTEIVSFIDYYIGPFRLRIIKERLFGKMLCRFGYHNMACIARSGSARNISGKVIHTWSEPFKNRCLRPGCKYEKEFLNE